MNFDYQNVIETLSNKIKLLEIDNAIMTAQLLEVQKERNNQVKENELD